MDDEDIPDFAGDTNMVAVMQEVFVAGWANAKRKTAEMRKARGFKKVGNRKVVDHQLAPIKQEKG